jgi:starvation-inducible DNA-binding protein
MAAKPLIDALLTSVAETFVLQTRTQNYHWNVEGMQFHSLHGLFEEQYDALSEAVDELAERVRALDAKVPDILELVKSRITSKKAKQILDAKAMIADLVKGHEAVIKQLEKVESAADDAEDEPTEDMAIARIAEHQKMIWMLKAHTR